LMRARGLAIPEIEHIGGAVPVVKATPLAANARTNWDGVYTDAQAQRGRDVYRRACAVCHLGSLEGDAVSPPLLGPAFLRRFNGQTAHEMVQAVRASMPQNAPDTLGDRAYVDLIAFLLNANGGPSGASELPLDVAELEKIVITPEQR